MRLTPLQFTQFTQIVHTQKNMPPLALGFLISFVVIVVFFCWLSSVTAESDLHRSLVK